MRGVACVGSIDPCHASHVEHVMCMCSWSCDPTLPALPGLPMSSPFLAADGGSAQAGSHPGCGLECRLGRRAAAGGGCGGGAGACSHGG